MVFSLDCWMTVHYARCSLQQLCRSHTWGVGGCSILYTRCSLHTCTEGAKTWLRKNEMRSSRLVCGPSAYISCVWTRAYALRLAFKRVCRPRRGRARRRLVPNICCGSVAAREGGDESMIRVGMLLNWLRADSIQNRIEGDDRSMDAMKDGKVTEG